MATTTVAIDQESVNKVKAHIIGTGMSIGEFYAYAANIAIYSNPPQNGVQDLTSGKVTGKPYSPF